MRSKALWEQSPLAFLLTVLLPTYAEDAHSSAHPGLVVCSGQWGKGWGREVAEASGSSSGMHVTLTLSSLCDDCCPDNRAFGQDTMLLACLLSEGRNWGTAALLPGPAGPALS